MAFTAADFEGKFMGFNLRFGLRASNAQAASGGGSIIQNPAYPNDPTRITIQGLQFARDNMAKYDVNFTIYDGNKLKMDKTSGSYQRIGSQGSYRYLQPVQCITQLNRTVYSVKNETADLVGTITQNGSDIVILIEPTHAKLQNGEYAGGHEFGFFLSNSFTFASTFQNASYFGRLEIHVTEPNAIHGIAGARGNTYGSYIHDVRILLAHDNENVHTGNLITDQTNKIHIWNFYHEGFNDNESGVTGTINQNNQTITFQPQRLTFWAGESSEWIGASAAWNSNFYISTLQNHVQKVALQDNMNYSWDASYSYDLGHLSNEDDENDASYSWAKPDGGNLYTERDLNIENEPWAHYKWDVDPNYTPGWLQSRSWGSMLIYPQEVTLALENNMVQCGVSAPTDDYPVYVAGNLHLTENAEYFDHAQLYLVNGRIESVANRTDLNTTTGINGAIDITAHKHSWNMVACGILTQAQLEALELSPQAWESYADNNLMRNYDGYIYYNQLVPKAVLSDAGMLPAAQPSQAPGVRREIVNQAFPYSVFAKVYYTTASGLQPTFHGLKTRWTTTGLDDVPLTHSAPATELGHYDLQGRSIDPMAPGVHIIRLSDGTARKQVVQ